GAILCVANWTPGKGIHTLVAAVARVPDVSLDLVGDAPDPAYAARVRREIAARGLGKRVRVYGSLGRTALARRYAAAFMFAIPPSARAAIVGARATATDVGRERSAVRSRGQKAHQVAISSAV